MSVPPEANCTVAVVSPAAPSGTDNGLLAPGTAGNLLGRAAHQEHRCRGRRHAAGDERHPARERVLAHGAGAVVVEEFLNQVLLKLAKLGHGGPPQCADHPPPKSDVRQGSCNEGPHAAGGTAATYQSTTSS